MSDVAFDLQHAVLCARLSEIAYLPFEIQQDVIELPLKALGLTLVKSFNGPKTDSQAILVKTADFAVLAFRGTEVQKWSDVLCDIQSKLAQYETGFFHSGFFNSFGEIQKEIEVSLDSLADIPIYVTGHSLGGALAKMAILVLPKRKWHACYTYGAPAICDLETGNLCKVPLFQIIDQGDLVPRIINLSPMLVPFILAFLGICSWWTEKAQIQPNWFADKITFFKALGTDLVKYAQFGSEYCLENDKLSLLSDKQASLKIYFRILFENSKEQFADHAIALYINRLEKLT